MTTLELPLNLKKGKQQKTGGNNTKKNVQKPNKTNKMKFTKNNRGKIVRNKNMEVRPKQIVRVSDDAELLAEHADQGFLQPSTQIFRPDAGSVLEYIDQVIARYSMCTEIFNYPNNIHPSYMGMYLQMCFLAYIKRNGQLTGGSAGLVPNDMKGWAIPLPFARFLQGFGRYSENGTSFEMNFDHSITLDISRTGWGYDDTATIIGTRTLFPATFTIMSMELNQKKYELQPFYGYLDVTIYEQNFSDLVLTPVSEAISTAGLAYCWGENIPANAEDASAYTYINADVTSVTGTFHFMSPADKYYPEVALLYSKHSVVPATSSPASYSCKCICRGMDTDNGAPPWFLQPVGASVFIMSEYKKWPKGPIHNLKYCKTRLETLFPVRVPLSWWGFANLVAQHYTALTSTFPVNQQYLIGGGGTPAYINNPDYVMNHFFSYQTTCWMAMAANWLRKIPYYRQYIVGQASTVSYSPQFFFASAAWLMAKLPPVIASAITDTGPVVYRGRLYYPDFSSRVLSNNPATAPTHTGTIWSPVEPGWVVSLALTDNQDTFLGNNIWRADGYDTSLTYKLQSYVMNNETLDIGEVNELYGNAIPTGYYPIYTLNLYSNAIIADFYSYHSTISEASSMNKNLIHLHYEKCGATYQMLMNVGVSENLNIITLLPSIVSQNIPAGNPTDTYPQIYMAYQLRSPSQVASLVQANSDDVVLSVVYSMNIIKQSAAAPPLTGIVSTVPNEIDGKYTLQLPAAASSASLGGDLIQETYAINSSFSSALAKRQAMYRDTLSESIITAVVPPNMDHCFIGKLFKSAVRAVSSVLRVGVGLAAGAVCGAATAAIGAEPAVPITTMACSVGAKKIYDYVASRVGIDSNDIVASNKTAKPGVRATSAGVKRTANEVRQTLRVPAVSLAGSK